MRKSCSCGGFALKTKAKRDGLTLCYVRCGACGRCGGFVLEAHGVTLTRGEVARRAFGDMALTGRLVARAKQRATTRPETCNASCNVTSPLHRCYELDRD